MNTGVLEEYKNIKKLSENIERIVSEHKKTDPEFIQWVKNCRDVLTRVSSDLECLDRYLSGTISEERFQRGVEYGISNTHQAQVQVTLNLPEDQEILDNLVNGRKYKSALWEISQEVFRPHRKHGYHERDIQNIIEGEGGDKCLEVISKLEEKFCSILNDESINLY